MNGIRFKYHSYVLPNSLEIPNFVRSSVWSNISNLNLYIPSWAIDRLDDVYTESYCGRSFNIYDISKYNKSYGKKLNLYLKCKSIAEYTKLKLKL